MNIIKRAICNGNIKYNPDNRVCLCIKCDKSFIEEGELFIGIRCKRNGEVIMMTVTAYNRMVE